MPISNCQPYRLLNAGCWYKSIYWMTNSADPDQMKPTDLDLYCLQRKGISRFSWTRVNSHRRGFYFPPFGVHVSGFTYVCLSCGKHLLHHLCGCIVLQVRASEVAKQAYLFSHLLCKLMSFLCLWVLCFTDHDSWCVLNGDYNIFFCLCWGLT